MLNLNSMSKRGLGMRFVNMEMFVKSRSCSDSLIKGRGGKVLLRVFFF